jgi:hypothetical protein
LKRFLLLHLSLLIGAAIWLPCLHLLFRADPRDYRAEGELPDITRAIAARQIALWQDTDFKEHELAQMRAINAEWDFMGRTYLVLALANMACREPDKEAEYLDGVDRIIADTLRVEEEKGLFHFLMSYARGAPFVVQPPRSLFLDGEIALMMAARRLIKEKPDYKALMDERIDTMITRMEESPVLAAESYPNECWVFCNTVAVAAIKLSDILDGPRHADFLERWLEITKREMLDPGTGLLYASYDVAGVPLQGPEGSSIWMAAHCLQLVDEEFAQDQYDRAKKELARSVLGFGYAREWPPSYTGPADVDSGPVIAGISTASSGLAFMGASTFGDTDYLQRLLTSLRFAGFPVETDGRLMFCASNQVGDAVVLYAAVLGPLWEKARLLEEKQP